MEIISKTSPQRIDPRKPESHPDYQRAVEAGRRNWPAMEAGFANRGEKEKYLQAVKGNVNNIVGLPVLYPVEETKSYMQMEDRFSFNETPEQESLRHFMETVEHQKVDLYCGRCETITPHFGIEDNLYCPNCGTKNKLRKVAVFH